MASPLRISPTAGLVAALLLGPVAVCCVLSFGFDPVQHAAMQPMAHRAGGHVGATNCRACHPDQHRSWASSWHATMTQVASQATVQAEFNGVEVQLYGKTARPYQRDERFFIDLPTAPGGRRQAEVALAVGSHRYQQFFEQVDRGRGTVLQRLPLLWSIAERRWLHVNGLFLDPDGPSWHRPAATWNENCIFCHNTAPQPGIIDWASRPTALQKQFDSRVADLGIACESCHGAGAEHAAAMRDPTVRYRAYLGGSIESRIIQPTRLDQERAVAVCGQCHGQRMPKHADSIEALLTTGPTYRSGDRLEDHVTPLQQHSKIPGHRGDLALRFWGDGTPRLSAYEYQGVVASACYRRGEMTCFSCHAQHSGQRDGMIKPGMGGDQSCLQCHREIGRDVAAHTRHEVDSSGSRCLECHMPRIAYGLRSAMRSHRIDSPDPARDARAGRPNACTLCHLDQSLNWAASSMQRMFGTKYRMPAPTRVAGALDWPDALVSLLTGDPVQRVVYATAAANPAAAVPVSALVEMRLALLATLGDPYATVRNVARLSLLRLEARQPLGYADELRRYNPMATTVAQRRAKVAGMLSSFAERGAGRLELPDRRHIVGPDLQADLAALVRLLNQQPRVAISIGE